MAEEYFDWVTGLHNCDICVEFKKLAEDARKNVETHNEFVGSKQFRFVWDRKQSPDVCTVVRPGGASVDFRLKEDVITVRRLNGNDVGESMELQAELDEQGQCILVGDSGRILRWHILREYLGPLFDFDL